MSAETIIADIEADLANFSNEGKSVVATILARLTSIAGAITSVGGPLGTALTDVGAIVTSALSAGATVAAAATNPVAAAVAIGSIAAPVSALFVEAFDEVKGFVEGLEGQTPATGATTQETDGAAAGAGTKNLFDAIVDSVKATF
jgi:hypothetical protein